MRRKDNHQKDSAEKTVRDIRRATRRRFSAEEKIRIVLEGLRGCTSSKPFGQRVLGFKGVSGSSVWPFKQPLVGSVADLVDLPPSPIPPKLRESEVIVSWR